ncbi:helix-turn-helix transcriptional regulator [Clostridium sp. Mt-5]|uniref:Helix-turn-helix transcriptional regulator n=1 Tax=Clostridium moutaii TaxID=3240932 RepID=A0ABV4BXF9_9CLOT
MRISRLFEIVYILLDKKIATARELADHFEVSVRTIYRDIDVLSNAGVPVYANQGKGGGITLLDDFVLNKSVLSEQEQNDILVALQNLSATRYPNIDFVLSRLSSLFKKKDSNWIEIDFSPWGSDEKHKEKFNLLKMALVNNHIITFDYFNTSGIKSSRRAEPAKLIFKDRAWYLIAFCYERKAYRTFRITRMSNVQVTDDIFDKRSPEELSSDTDKEPFHDSINLQLKVSSTGAYRVYDDFYEEDVRRNDDGSFTITTSLPGGDWIYNYLLSFGPILEGIKPQSLCNELKDKMQMMMQNLSREMDSQ